MPNPYSVSSDSPFLENACAFCKADFVLGDEIVVCPQDGARHHAACWQANENHCSAYGCSGEGEVGQPQTAVALEGEVIQENGRSAYQRVAYGRSKVRTLPQVRFGCGRGCCFMVTVILLLLVGATCFGLWAFTDLILEWFSELATTGVILPLY